VWIRRYIVRIDRKKIVGPKIAALWQCPFKEKKVKKNCCVYLLMLISSRWFRMSSYLVWSCRPCLGLATCHCHLPVSCPIIQQIYLILGPFRYILNWKEIVTTSLGEGEQKSIVQRCDSRLKSTERERYIPVLILSSFPRCFYGCGHRFYGGFNEAVSVVSLTPHKPLPLSQWPPVTINGSGLGYLTI
jgi:hypothetical protein